MGVSLKSERESKVKDIARKAVACCMSAILAFGLSPIGQTSAYAVGGSPDSAVQTQEVAGFGDVYYVTGDDNTRANPTITYNGANQEVKLFLKDSVSGKTIDPRLYTVSYTTPASNAVVKLPQATSAEPYALNVNEAGAYAVTFTGNTVDTGTGTGGSIASGMTYAGNVVALEVKVSKFDLGNAEFVVVESGGDVIDPETGIAYDGSEHLVTARPAQGYEFLAGDVVPSVATAIAEGRYSVEVTPYGGDSNKNVTGSKTVIFRIARAQIPASDDEPVEGSSHSFGSAYYTVGEDLRANPSITYNGSSQTVTVMVKDSGSHTTVSPKFYELSYTKPGSTTATKLPQSSGSEPYSFNVKDAGTYQIALSGNTVKDSTGESYAGSFITLDLEVAKFDLGDAEFVAVESNGSAINPQTGIAYDGSEHLVTARPAQGYEFLAGDVVPSVVTAIAEGMYSVEVMPYGGYSSKNVTGSKTVIFHIARAQIPASGGGVPSGEGEETAASKPVAGVSLDKGALTLAAGASARLTATIAPSDAANKALRWASSNARVVTVDQAGGVRALAAGSAVVRATTVDGGYMAQCMVTVLPSSKGKLLSVEALPQVTVDNGTALDDIEWMLEREATIEVESTAGPIYSSDVPIRWNAAPPYRIDDEAEQVLAFTGTIELPSGVQSADGSSSVAVVQTVVVLAEAEEPTLSEGENGDEPYTEELDLTSVRLSQSRLIYNGKAQQVSVKSVKAGSQAVPSSAYTVSGLSGKAAGTYTVTVEAKKGSGYSGSATATFTIKRATSTVTAKSSVSRSAVAKKAATVVTVKAPAAAGNIIVSKAQTPKNLRKFVKVSSDHKKVKIAKGAKKGTYLIAVQVKGGTAKTYTNVDRTVYAVTVR